MAYNNLTDRATGNTVTAADINTLSENIRVIGGNGTSEPSTDIETLNTQLAAIENPTSSTKITDYTILDDDGFSVVILSGASANSTFTLPTLADNLDREITLFNNDSTYELNVDGEGTETIDGMTDIDLPKSGNYLKLKAISTGWLVLDESITSELSLDTYAGYGSTDTKIMQFTNSDLDIGNMFSHNHGSYGTAGLEVTIERSGTYAFFWSFVVSATLTYFGVSLNSSELTTSFQAIALANRLTMGWGDASYRAGSVAARTMRLEKNDVIRCHSNGIAPYSSGIINKTFFGLVYLGK